MRSYGVSRLRRYAEIPDSVISCYIWVVEAVQVIAGPVPVVKAVVVEQGSCYEDPFIHTQVEMAGEAEGAPGDGQAVLVRVSRAMLLELLHLPCPGV